MGIRMKIAAALAVGALAILLGGAPAKAADPLCEVSSPLATQWTNGYMVNITIRNVTTRPVSWRANVILQPPGVIIQGWGGVFTASATQVSIYPPPYPSGGVIQPGESHIFGYVGSGPVVYPQVACY
ncbi:cellulose binding domain-containing protein [Micromonospora sp. CPCC 206061]|uniref:cellulose binding domain-containing protein n=1 Tax=Micromonospora sp. CPCC 206061 TaxID=3122410 RepID=UPI002FF0F5D9